MHDSSGMPLSIMYCVVKGVGCRVLCVGCCNIVNMVDNNVSMIYKEDLSSSQRKKRMRHREQYPRANKRTPRLNARSVSHALGMQLTCHRHRNLPSCLMVHTSLKGEGWLESEQWKVESGGLVYFSNKLYRQMCFSWMALLDYLYS